MSESEERIEELLQMLDADADLIVMLKREKGDLEERLEVQFQLLEAAERGLADAEKIIESHTGPDSWVGSSMLVRVRDALDAGS